MEKSKDLHNYEKYLSSRGTCYHEMGKLELARKDFDAALSRNPKLVSALNNRASVLVDMGLYEEALSDANEGIRLRPKFGNVYKQRGLAHFHLDNYAHCVDDLQKSIRLAPTYRPARASLKKVWDFYFEHVKGVFQVKDIARVLVDYMVGDNYQTHQKMVGCTYGSGV